LKKSVKLTKSRPSAFKWRCMEFAWRLDFWV